MLQEANTEQDLKDLTVSARSYWEYDLTSEPKRIRRRVGFWREKVPMRAIYRMTKEDWKLDAFASFEFPFVTSSFSGVIGLNGNWAIDKHDRRYIEKDMVLFAADGRTVLISHNPDPRWWEASWFHAASIGLGIVGALSLFVKSS